MHVHVVHKTFYLRKWGQNIILISQKWRHWGELRKRTSGHGSRGTRGWTGTNCIKIGLPGKSILGDYFQENRTSQRPFLFPGRPIFIQFDPASSWCRACCRPSSSAWGTSTLSRSGAPATWETGRHFRSGMSCAYIHMDENFTFPETLFLSKSFQYNENKIEMWSIHSKKVIYHRIQCISNYSQCMAFCRGKFL